MATPPRSTTVAPARGCVGAPFTPSGVIVTVTSAVADAVSPRPSDTVYRKAAVPDAPGRVVSCRARPPRTGWSVPRDGSMGSTSEITSTPQLDDASFSMGVRSVVVPGRAPYSSASAVGADAWPAHSASVSRGDGSAWSGGTSSVVSGSSLMSVQFGSRTAGSFMGSQTLPPTSSFSTTTSRFTRKTRLSPDARPSRSTTSGSAPGHAMR